MDRSRVLWGHSHSHCFTSCLVLSSPLTVSRYDLWPAKSEILTTWPFVERAYSRELGPAESEFLGVPEAFLKEPGDPGLYTTDSGVRVDLLRTMSISSYSSYKQKQCVSMRPQPEARQTAPKCLWGIGVFKVLMCIEMAEDQGVEMVAAFLTNRSSRWTSETNEGCGSWCSWLSASIPGSCATMCDVCFSEVLRRADGEWVRWG